MKTQFVYLLSQIGFDYYRFEKTIGIFSSIKNAKIEAKRIDPELKCYFYEVNQYKKLSKKLRREEVDHFQIRKFEIK